MENYRTSGTSALKLRPCDWNLWKVADQERYAAYALTAPDTDCLPIVARVMHALLDERQVAMICEQADDAFSVRFMAYLQELCTDGRRLKRGNSSAFIAITDDLQENLLTASLLGAQAEGANPHFRFVGFHDAVPLEVSFNALLEQSRTSGVEIVFDGAEDMTLHIGFDPSDEVEADIVGAIRNAITASGGTLNLSLQ